MGINIQTIILSLLYLVFDMKLTLYYFVYKLVSSFKDCLLILSGTHGERFECPMCGRLYKWKKDRDRHAKFECSLEPQYECEICGRKFKQKRGVNQHMMVHHFTSTKIISDLLS